MPDRNTPTQRWYAFLSAADDSGPAWQVYARRLGAPLAIGITIGLILYAITVALPQPFGSVFILVVAVTGLVWTVGELRSINRVMDQAEEMLERAEDAIRRAEERH